MKKIIALVLGFVAVASFASAATNEELTQQFLAGDITLTQFVAGIEANATASVTTTATTTGEKTYTYTRLLKKVTRGEDVRELQTCLNRIGYSTGVADGIFGSNTERGVKAFQAAKGLAVDGIIGRQTGPKFEEACAIATTTATTTTTTEDNEVDGDKLVVSGVAADDMIVGEDQKVIFTKLTLTAGDKDVMVKDINVEVTGTANSDVIKDVLLLDSAKLELDNDGVDSDDEAKLDADIEVKDGESVVVYIAAIIERDKVAANDGLDVSIKVTSVTTDGADVEGDSVMGASHTIQDNVTVGVFDVTLDEEESDAKIGDNNVELATINVEESDDDSNQDITVFSMKLTRTGSASDDSLSDVTITVDGKSYKGVQDDEEYTFDFGSGIEIDNGEDMDFVLTADVEEDAGTTATFEVTDVVAEDENNILLTAVIADDSSDLDIEESEITLSSTSEVGDENVAAGTEAAELASFEVEVTGEDIEAELAVQIVMDDSSADDFNDVDLDNIAVYDMDGNRVTDKEDADWSADGDIAVVTFDISLETGDDAVEYVIKGDINKDAPTSTTYTVEEIAIYNAETTGGEDLDETEDFDMDGDGTDETTIAVVVENLGTTQTVESSALEAKLSDPSDDVNADTDGEVVAEIELDSTDSGDMVNVSEIELEYTGAVAEADVENCELFDGDTSVSNREDADSVKMTFDVDIDVDDEVKTLEMRCDIADNADVTVGTNIDFEWISITSEGDVTGVEVSTDEDNITPTGTSTVDIVVGTLEASLDSDTPDDMVVLEGEEVVLGTMEIEANDGPITVDEIDFKLSAFTDTADEVINGNIDIYVDGDRIDSESAAATITFSNLNIDLEDGDRATVEFRGDVNDVDDIATTTFNAEVTVVRDDSATAVLATGTPVTFNDITIVEAMPFISQVGDDTITVTTSLEADKNVHEFKITAENDDITIDDVTYTFALNGTIELQNAELKVYSDSAYDNEEDAVAITVAEGDVTGTLTAPIVISKGDTYYFVLEADIVAANGDSATITVLDSDPADATGGITISEPEIDSDLILEDDIKTTINTEIN